MDAAIFRRRFERCAAILAVVLAAATAHAAPPGPGGADAQSAEDRKRADELFQEGRRLMREGRATEACPILERSQELDPAGGTLLNLSRCYESLGRFASADRVLGRAWRLGRVKGRDDAVDFIEGERARLAAAIDRAVLRMPSLPPDAEVRLDGEVVESRSERVSIDIDPGPHEVTTRAPGHAPATKRFELQPKDDLAGRSIEVLVPSPQPEPPRPDALAPKRAAPEEAPRRSAADDPGSSLMPLGTVAVVGGGVLVGAGLVLGLVAASTWSSVEQRCPTERCNDVGARADADTASAIAALSTGFTLGGLGIGGLGIGLIVVSPSSAGPSAGEGARATVRGAF